MAYVSYKDRKSVALDLKAVYRSATSEEAEARLEEFGSKVGRALPDDREIVASQLGADHADVRLPGRNQASDLYDECHRVIEYEPEESDQDQSVVPE